MLEAIAEFKKMLEAHACNLQLMEIIKEAPVRAVRDDTDKVRDALRGLRATMEREFKIERKRKRATWRDVPRLHSEDRRSRDGLHRLYNLSDGRLVYFDIDLHPRAQRIMQIYEVVAEEGVGNHDHIRHVIKHYLDQLEAE